MIYAFSSIIITEKCKYFVDGCLCCWSDETLKMTSYFHCQIDISWQEKQINCFHLNEAWQEKHKGEQKYAGIGFMKQLLNEFFKAKSSCLRNHTKKIYTGLIHYADTRMKYHSRFKSKIATTWQYKREQGHPCLVQGLSSRGTCKYTWWSFLRKSRTAQD